MRSCRSSQRRHRVRGAARRLRGRRGGVIFRTNWGWSIAPSRAACSGEEGAQAYPMCIAAMSGPRVVSASDVMRAPRRSWPPDLGGVVAIVAAYSRPFVRWRTAPGQLGMGKQFFRTTAAALRSVVLRVTALLLVLAAGVSILAAVDERQRHVRVQQESESSDGAPFSRWPRVAQLRRLPAFAPLIGCHRNTLNDLDFAWGTPTPRLRRWFRARRSKTLERCGLMSLR